MTRSVLILSVLALAARTLPAEEDDFARLDALDQKIRKLAQASVVAIVRRVPDRKRTSDATILRPTKTTNGVLVGSPPRLVIPYSAAGNSSTIYFRFADGYIGNGQLIDLDGEIGIAVYSVANAHLESKSGLVPETKWLMKKGRSAFLPIDARVGGPVGLVKIGRLRQGWGTLRAMVPAGMRAGTPLLSPKGRLWGLYLGEDAQADPIEPRRVPLVRDKSSESGVTNGIFLPAPIIARVVRDISTSGRIRHGYLGIVLGAARRGGLISSVLAGSRAAVAGLRAGDVITAVNGVYCADAAAVSRALALHGPGETIRLSIPRWKHWVEVELAASRVKAQRALVQPGSLGLEVVALDHALRKYLGLPQDRTGVAVSVVKPKSLAGRAGLRRGDVIIEGGGGTIADLDEFKAALASSGGWIELLIVREGESVPLAVAMRTPNGESKTK